MQSWPICHSMLRAAACCRILTSPMRHPDPASAGRVELANTLNLLPGTLSMGLEGAPLRLHVLDTRHPIVAEMRTAERQLVRMLGLQLAA